MIRITPDLLEQYVTVKNLRYIGSRMQHVCCCVTYLPTPALLSVTKLCLVSVNAQERRSVKHSKESLKTDLTAWIIPG